MQKIFSPSDILEFKIDNKWQMGTLQDINISENKFQIFLSKENTTVDHISPSLSINTLNLDTILSSDKTIYKVEDKVEFFDDSTHGWIEGKIKNSNGDFFLINFNFNTKNTFNNNDSKIIHKNNLRPVTKSNDVIKFGIDSAEVYELKNFEELSDPVKLGKKTAKQLIELFNEEISFIFLNDKLQLFIFRNKSFNSNSNNNGNNMIKKDIIEGLINIAFKHFEEIDQKNQKLFK